MLAGFSGIDSLVVPSSDKSFMSQLLSMPAVTFEELSRATWLLGSILNIDYNDNTNRNSRKLIQSLLRCVNNFFLAKILPIEKSTARDGDYRVHLLRLMSGLEKLGVTWDIISEKEFGSSYLDLLNVSLISDDKVSNTTADVFEQSREVATILWTLGRMGFDINNTSHIGSFGCAKKVILEQVWQIFLSECGLKGQTVTMTLKGLSKMGYSWTDFEDTPKPINKDIVNNDDISNDSGDQKGQIQALQVSSLASVILSVCMSGSVELELTELVVVIQALAFMKVSWNWLAPKFQFYLLSVFAEHLNELSTKDFSLLVRSLGYLGYEDSCLAATASDKQSVDENDTSFAKRIEEGIVKYLIKFGQKFNYFDIECTLQGLNTIKVSLYAK